MRSWYTAALVLLAGCFDSLLDAPCREGLTLRYGQCVAVDTTPAPDSIGNPDAIRPPTPTAPNPIAPSCEAELATDPDNCGSCGHVCASGICAAGACLGEVAGHVVAIGHDYGAANAAMRRVLGNAAALGTHHDLAIGRWAPSAAVTYALSHSLAQLGRPWHTVALSSAPTSLAALDVVLVDPQAVDDAEAFGASWSTELAMFLDGGGVIIVLEGAGGTNHRFALGAALFVSATPTIATSEHLSVVAPSDSVAQQVLSPYAAAATSVAFPGLDPVIATPSGDAVVFHAAR